MRLQHVVCLVAILWAGLDSAPGQQVDIADRSGELSASREQITRWVKNLDADRFVLRRVATEKLVLVGQPAIKPIQQSLADSNLEVSTRGVFVLRQLALSGDLSTEEAAVNALRDIAEFPSSSAARIAADTLDTLEEVRQIKAIKRLQQLGAIIEQDPLASRFQQQSLWSIEIGPGWQGTAADLERLKWLNNVHVAKFEGPRIEDRSLQQIQHLQDLQKLVIKHAKISDAALESIGDLQQLIAMDILYTPLTDACLEDLLAVQSLRQLRVIGTRISTAGVERFQAAAAQVEVDYKNGAFLGVRCQQPPWPCEVVQVTPNSAAAIAGIQPGDVIVRYAGQAVADFEALRKLIARNYVGDSVAIHVARQGRTVVVDCRHRIGQGLGIETRKSPFGCEVTKVTEKSEAAAAGIHVGDVIAVCDDIRVVEPDQLKKVYAQRPTSSNTTIELLRGIQQVEVKATFGEWQE